MHWFISLEQFEELATSRPTPPYFLLLAGLLIILSCLIPLTIGVRQSMKYWSTTPSPDGLTGGGRLQVILPFLGTVGGVCILLAAALEVLGSPVIPAIFFSLLFTIVIGYFTWLQLGKVLSRRIVRSYIKQSSDFPSVEDSSFNRRPG